LMQSRIGCAPWGTGAWSRPFLTLAEAAGRVGADRFDGAGCAPLLHEVGRLALRAGVGKRTIPEGKLTDGIPVA